MNEGIKGFPGIPAAAAPSADIVQLRDERASGTSGGAASISTWTKRTVNTEVADTGGLCSLASSVFTLQPGTYDLVGFAQFYAVANARIRLQNTSDGITVILGGSGYFSGGDFGAGPVPIVGRFTISAAKNFELQYWVAASTGAADLGSSGSTGVSEVFVDLFFRKVA